MLHPSGLQEKDGQSPAKTISAVKTELRDAVEQLGKAPEKGTEQVLAQRFVK